MNSAMSTLIVALDQLMEMEDRKKAIDLIAAFYANASFNISVEDRKILRNQIKDIDAVVGNEIFEDEQDLNNFVVEHFK